MKRVITAGTDGASLCAFDPAALPADFDTRMAADPAGLLERLRDEGRLWHAETGSDGTCVIEVSVDEPETAGPVPTWTGAIAVPSGRLWVCGAEYAARDPRMGSKATPKGGLGRYRMGDCLELPPGTYRLAATVLPSDVARAGATPEWLRSLPFIGVLFGGLGTLVMLIAIVAQLVARARQSLAGIPTSEQPWDKLPPVMAGLVVALAVAAAGWRLGQHVDGRLAAGGASRAPSLILSLRRESPGATQR